ncbi:hypothetical protein QFC19_008601 [Naganishia cerealis]|uniref:Uncharacterized protein n=1 Tax=Naganishia cerealis TaxID=610337 RepID=A0ACC2V0N5_9TREE|nr:hypothetical protein QFC19_008601 [Naganishia cerealis]
MADEHPTQPAVAQEDTKKEVPLDENGQPLSKGEIKRREKEAAKAAKAAERAAKEQAAKEKKAAEEANDTAAENYGKLPLHQSQERSGRTRLSFESLMSADAASQYPESETVIIRARVHNARAQGAKMAFVTLRQQTLTLQGVVSISKEGDEHAVSKQMVKYVTGIPMESIVLVEGVIKPAEVKSCTIQTCEIQIRKIHTIVEVTQRLPFGVDEASRTEADYAKEDSQFPRVNLDTRLDNRVMDLRTPVNQAIFRVQSAVCQLFREQLNSLGFIEIHSPKLQGAATESGSSVFEVSYFKGKAFLAQSPQLAKQMCIAGDMERVYEIGPVFRAEDSNTHRHLCEFTGLDLEMAIEEHYHEVLDVLDSLFLAIFKGLKEKFSHEVATIATQFPCDEFTWLDETLKLAFADGIKMLKDAGAKNLDGSELSESDDLSTENERWLGRLVKEKYGTDYYILDKFPLAIRPFYTMPDATNPALSNSYDFFMRGEEILSGAQRIHDPEFLIQRMKECGIEPASMQGYIDAFNLGAPPHAGGGIGLERVVMLFLKLGNIRRASLFPRDPKRLNP